MSATLLRPHQISAEAAPDGHELRIVGGKPMWMPSAVPAGGSAGQVLTKRSGADFDTDWETPSGGGGGSTFPLDPSSLNATYGDHFNGSSLAAKWNRVGYVAGDEQYQQGGGTWLQVDTARGAANYYWQTAPAGDFTVVMKLMILASAANMFGPMILDSSGNGVQAAAYSSGDAYYALGVTGVGYSGSSQAIAATVSNKAWSGSDLWLKLAKVGTSYRASISLNGHLWWKQTGALTFATTPTRIGFGSILGNPGSFAVDWFDVQ